MLRIPLGRYNQQVKAAGEGLFSGGRVRDLGGLVLILDYFIDFVHKFFTPFTTSYQSLMYGI
jgi:hypothetical protein